MSMLKKFFNQKEIHRYEKHIKIINDLYFQWSKRNEVSSLDYPQELKKIRGSKMNNKEKVYHAMALAKIACEKILKMSYYDVQIMGALALVDRKIAQMKTGEGKTLMCSAAVIANHALGVKVHVATANEYLAQRDEQTLRPLYEYLGIKSAFNTSQTKPEEKKLAYEADVVYSTAQEMGFDYLRDSLIKQKEQKIQPEDLSTITAIIDEADFILIDEARTPLIISGQTQSQETQFYHDIKDLALKLQKISHEPIKDKYGNYPEDEGDFWIDEKNRAIHLMEKGYLKIEQALIKNGLISSGILYDVQNLWLIEEVTNALKAHYLFIRNKHYIVKDEEIVIIDENTGRLSEGRTWSDGLHQAIEAKENTNINPLNATLRTVSIQNYFRNYGQISGMTGTALSCAQEFEEIYQCQVVEIPTYKPMVRVDNFDQIYLKAKNKYEAILKDIKNRHQKGQPILVGTTSVEESELISQLLQKENIFHYVLNAKNNALEAQLISQAGLPYAVTVSTNMAGRGTDIILGGNPKEMLENNQRRLEKIKQMKNDLLKLNPLVDEKMELNNELLNEHFKNLIHVHQFLESLNGYLQYHLNVQVTPMTDEFLESLNNYWIHLNYLENKIQRDCDDIEKNHHRKKEEALKAGGLCVIGCSRNESRRVDDQIRGRAGRQGDVGESTFYMSFEDNWLEVFGQNAFMKMLSSSMPEDQVITSKVVSNSIEKAQKSIESMHFDMRKNVYQYDTVLNDSRIHFFKMRQNLIESEKAIKEIFLQQIEEKFKLLNEEYLWTHHLEKEGRSISLLDTLDEILDKNNPWENKEKNLELFMENIFELSPVNAQKIVLLMKSNDLENKSKKLNSEKELLDFFKEQILNFFNLQEDGFWSWFKEQSLTEFDQRWMNYLSVTNEIRMGAGLTAIIQKNPLYEYKKSCFELFKNLIQDFKSGLLKNTLENLEF